MQKHHRHRHTANPLREIRAIRDSASSPPAISPVPPRFTLAGPAFSQLESTYRRPLLGRATIEGFASMDVMLHIANVLFLLAYLVRDILWLRIITVIATASLIPYYFCCAVSPLYGPILWNSLFISVNLVQIVLLILEKRPVFLSDKEMQLYRTVFSALKPREFTKLLSLAEWRTAKPGEVLLEQDQPVQALLLISSGSGVVEIDGRRVATVTSGQFIGEMGFLSEQVASAKVAASAPTEYLAWPAGKLRTLLFTTPMLHVKVQGILGCDLVDKLRLGAMTAAHPSRFLHNPA
jgi:hypothetical protein